MHTENDEVATALREVEEACPCRMDLTDYLHGTLPRLVRCNYNCPCHDYSKNGLCKWPGHAAARKLAEVARKAGREEAQKVAACPFDHAVLAANAVVLCVNCGERLRP